MDRLKAASALWQATLDERVLLHPLPGSSHTSQPTSHPPKHTNAHITQHAQHAEFHAAMRTPSAAFLEAEAQWRSLPPRRLWRQFQDIAWALHGEVDRLAFHGRLGDSSDLVFVLFRGDEFADGDAGGLCLGIGEDKQVFRPFAVIGISQEVRMLHMHTVCAHRSGDSALG